MPTAFVYAPVGGQITGRTKYCVCPGDSCSGSGSNHSTCKGWSTPVDIAGTGIITLFVNYPTVRSIITLVELKCCCAACADQYERTITVKLYALQNADGFIGSVMYGHVANPQVVHNMMYNLTSSSRDLGSVPTGSCSCGPFTCFSGPHCHMEQSGGVSGAPCCCVTANRGSTSIYQWSY